MSPQSPHGLPAGSAFGTPTGGGGSTRRIVVAGMSTLTVLVLLFGYHTSTEGVGTPATVAVAAGSSVGSSSGSSAGGSAGTSTGSSASGSSTVTGSAADTRWGPVQVEVTVTDGKISAVKILQQPDGNRRDEEINAQALPVLVQETLSAQSANIDMVSGATVTSTGYVQSLQSALDQVHA
ncbi:FMN-binding protein [Kineococcus sp. NPDC059986]|uniref:FMN-binding protein n=1 Tax=Kineococcus sp. NPDC059986 TaxID=3155538 RepID=UPI00344BCDB6